MAEPVVLEIRGKRYELVLTLAAICEFEQRAKKGIIEASVSGSIGGNFTDTLILLWAAAKTNSKNAELRASPKFFQDLLEPNDMPQVVETLLEVVKRTFPPKISDGPAEEGSAPLASSTS